MNRLKAIHRITGILCAAFLLYLSVSGLMIQGIDLRLIFSHAPQNDPDMMSMLETRAGGEYLVVNAADNVAQTLPAPAQLPALLHTALQAAHAQLGAAGLHYIELRMREGRPVGVARNDKQVATVDATDGRLLSVDPVPAPQGNQVDQNNSRRYRIKSWHRLSETGVWPLFVNLFVGVGLLILLATGMAIYFRLRAARAALGMKSWFWVGGTRSLADWKRAMHRWTAVLAAALLLVVACSGLWLAYESLVFGLRMNSVMAQMRRTGHFPMQARKPAPTLDETQMDAMLATTMSAAAKDLKGEPLKVIRLRSSEQELQGVVVHGEGVETAQVVFDARTGRAMSEIELSRPPQQIAPFPFGWDAHQIAKAVHRGSYFGLGARFLDLFAGLALLYLSINGVALYWEMWRERCHAGQRKFFWAGTEGEVKG